MEGYLNRIFKDPRLPYLELRYTCRSAHHYRPHRHATLSIGAIEEGVADFTSATERALLRPGTLIAIDPERIHACNPVEGEARSYYMLHLDRTWCTQLQRNLFAEVGSYRPFRSTLIEDRTLYEEYLSTAKLLLDPETLLLEKEERLEGLMRKLFGRHIDTALSEPEPREEGSAVARRTREYLREHLREDPTLEEIASALQTSRFSLIRRFKAHTGTTPHAYLLDLRIERARELLATDLPIAQIALEVGLSDQSHLNRLFKRYAACTPGEYRRGIVKSAANPSRSRREAGAQSAHATGESRGQRG